MHSTHYAHADRHGSAGGSRIVTHPSTNHSVPVAVLIRRLRQLQKESGTVLSAPAVDGTAAATPAQRYRTRQGGHKRRPVRGEPGGCGRGGSAPPAAAAPSATDGRQSPRRRPVVGRRGDRRSSSATARAVLLAQPVRGERRPGEGHIRGDGQGRCDGEERRVRDGHRSLLRRSPAAATTGRWPQHHDR